MPTKVDFTPDLKRVYQQFPAAYRSQYWPEIVKAVHDGDVDKAKAIAKENEARHPSIRAENVIARRVRIERAALFIMQARAEEQLEAIFDAASSRIAAQVAEKADRLGAIVKLRAEIKDAVTTMRRQMNKWVTDHIWFAIKMGFQNMGKAIQPIFDSNKERFKEELQEIALIEDRLFVGITPDLAKRGKAIASLGTRKWNYIATRIYKAFVSQNVRGLKPSERIWEITTGAENNLKRILINGIAQGEDPREIARQTKKFLTPEASGAESPGPGVYKSPFKNAMRLVRTETISAYNNSVAAWTKDKSWVDGIRVTLSSAHENEDECDDWAGKLVTPEEWEDTFPLHPHCMCQPTPVPKAEFLADFKSASEE